MNNKENKLKVLSNQLNKINDYNIFVKTGFWGDKRGWIPVNYDVTQCYDHGPDMDVSFPELLEINKWVPKIQGGEF